MLLAVLPTTALASDADKEEVTTLAERTTYEDVGIPEIDDLEWAGITRSKSATNLDENYESTLTLSFQHDVDLVIVQDGTNLENETFKFLEDLENQANIHVNVGLVIFGGTVPISWTSEKLLDLSNPTDYQTIYDALNYDGWDEVAGHSGSNVQAGLREARRMLEKDNTHEASDKFIIVMSDCAARMWD